MKKIFKNKVYFNYLRYFVWAFSLPLLIFVFWWFLAEQVISEVVFLDVGQGDATLLMSGSTQVLIDGGPTNYLASQLAQYIPALDHQLELVILTHPDKDHLQGLLDVLDNYQVQNLVLTGIYKDSALYFSFLEKLRRPDLNLLVTNRRYNFKLNSEVTLETVYPLGNTWGQLISEANNTSVVTVLKVNQFKVWLGGDLEEPVEELLLAEGLLAPVDILKISHHGSLTSSSPDFLAALQPKEVVIPVGDRNSYGHPAAEVLHRLRELKTNIHRTDQAGDIKLTFYEDRYYFN